MFTVLGAAGFIGRHLVDHLTQAGHEVFAPARDAPLDPDKHLGHVIYAIGLTADFRTRPFDTVQAHVCRLADVLAATNFESLLYLSSTRVYGSGNETSEDSTLAVRPQDSSDLYNLSKLMGESLCLQSGRAHVRIARLSNVIGPGDADTFLGALCKEAASGTIHLQTAPRSEKDYIRMDDAVGLLERIALGGIARIYNVASGRQISHGDWTEALAHLTGCHVAVAKEALENRVPSIAIERIVGEFDFASRPPLDMLAAIMDADS